MHAQSFAAAEAANIGGNAYDKYNTKNPIARALMNGFMGAFDRMVDIAGPRTAFEIGCGEGKLSARLLQRGIAVNGCDLEPEIVAAANAESVAHGFGERFSVRSVYDLTPREVSADLVMCCEVLEHVPDPQRALAAIWEQDAEFFLFSVPREPIWRILNVARGKYLADLGNTPGHIQHWSKRGFARLVSMRFDIIATASPLPWTMLLCRKTPH